MRIAIMGTGGIGGYYAGFLARGGEDVTCIARGDHLEAIRRDGLTIKSPIRGDFTVRVNATNDPADVGPVDLVIISVKAYDLENAAEACRPMVGPETVVLPIQNGIDHPERVGRILGMEHVIAGSAGLSARIDAPGVIYHVGSPPNDVTFGEVGGGITERCERILAAFQRGELPADLNANVDLPLWQKFVYICGHALTAVTLLPLGALMAVPETAQLYLGIMQEVAAVGRARGVPLAPDYAETYFERLKKSNPKLRASMSLDREAGRRIEVDTLNGAVVRVGREVGVPTPLNFAVWAVLKPFVNGTPELPA